MFKDTYDAAAGAAKAKVAYLKKNPVGFFLLSMLAGAYIGFGILLAFTIGGLLDGAPATKAVMGCAFGVALSLVVIAGAELFTGNNLVMSAGLFRKTVTFGDALKLWIICWIGNLAGGVVLSLIFAGSGLDSGKVGAFMAAGAAAKMAAPAGQLILRGILCNILVCLAVWCGFKCKSETAKLIMIFWCLLTFFTCGFEHSVANMTVLTVALLNPGDAAVSMGGYWYNLFFVTIDNMIGGIVFVSLPYFISSKD